MCNTNNSNDNNNNNTNRSQKKHILEREWKAWEEEEDMLEE